MHFMQCKVGCSLLIGSKEQLSATVKEGDGGPIFEEDPWKID